MSDLIKQKYSDTERMRMSLRCLELEISHVKTMMVMYRKIELMERSNSWQNGFWGWTQLMGIKRRNPETQAEVNYQEVAKECNRKHHMLNQLIEESEHDGSRYSNPTKH
jgi:hypothetical protein